MTAIITGDIIKSRKTKPENWLEDFKKMLQIFGEDTKDWEIYRGDEFQLKVKPEDALYTAFIIKAYLKAHSLNARIAIGIGKITYLNNKISQSNGSAFVRSGEMLDKIKKNKLTLAIHIDNKEINNTINIMLILVTTFVDKWLPLAAKTVFVALKNKTLTQEEIGNLLNINQAAVSRRLQRANYNEIIEVNNFYKEKIKTIVK